jgi:hypothetical protein
MRISLDEPKGKRLGSKVASIRRRRPRTRRRRRRTFESSTAQPQIKRKQKPEPARAADKQKNARARSHSGAVSAASPPASQRRSRWRTLGLRVLAAAILMIVIGAMVYLSTAEMFFVYGAEIVGSRFLPLDTIYQSAGVDELNIFWVNPKKVTQRIEELDGIKAARVHCSLPATVLIEVEERQPVVMWRAEAQESDWWLDEDDVVLPYHGVLSNTVFVVDSSERQLHVGDQIEPKGIVRSVQQLAAALPHVEVFYYQPEQGLSFSQRTPKGEWPVYLGDSQDLPHKIQVLKALTDYLVAQDIRPRYVDLRWPDHPAYGRAGGRATRGSN